MTERKPYPSDLTDAQWALVEPILTAWKAAHPSVSGHEGNYELRQIVNAIRYQGRTGVQWDYLPHDLPPKSATYYYFAVRHEALCHRVGVKDPGRGAVAAALPKMRAA